MVKLEQKILAIQLRKEGLSYSEILKQVQVAKATLSVWFKEVGLSVPQKQRLTQKRLDAAKRGAMKRKQQRIDITKKITNEAINETASLDKKVFWMVGAALYWAEGNKQKVHDVSCPVKFSNSDPKMVMFFIKWLKEFCNVTMDELKFELYIHKTANVPDSVRYWAKIVHANPNSIAIRYKKSTISYRKNKGNKYFGLVRVNVVRSANLNRKIMGWANSACEQFIHSGVV